MRKSEPNSNNCRFVKTVKPILGDCLAQSKEARLGKSDKIKVKHIETSNDYIAGNGSF